MREREIKKKKKKQSLRCSTTLISPIGFAAFPCTSSGLRMRTAACAIVEVRSSRSAHARAIGGFSPRDSGDRVERPLIYTEQSKTHSGKTSVKVCTRRSNDSSFGRVSDRANSLPLYTFVRALLRRQGVLNL